MSRRDSRYKEIARDLLCKIRHGEYPIDSPLPSRSTLVEMYDANMGTINIAMIYLEAQGYTYSVPGKATYVKTRPDTPASV